MNKKNIRMRQILFALVLGIVGVGCDDPSELGIELLPSTDLISVQSIIDYNNLAYIYSEDSLRTDETSKSLLGSIVDPILGKTTIDLACQYRLTYFPGFQPDAVADSIFLYLFYRDFYGDTVTPQRIKIYELNQSLYDTEKYYQDTDLASYKKNEILAEYEFLPKRTVAIDSTTSALDTLYQVLEIPLDMSLANKLIHADSTSISNIDSFLEFFKGLYIGVEDVNENGTILTLEMLANNYVNGSAVLMYYHETNPETGEPDTLSVPYVASNLSARVNSYRHDYSNSSIAGLINNEQQNPENIYIQSTGGLRSKIYIPALDSWKDSSNVAINKAELIFQVDTTVINVAKFPPPKQLLLTIIDDEGNEFLPRDYSFSSTYYGGKLNTSDYTYRFNIAQHMQEVVKGNFNNNGFFLSAAVKNSQYKRVVLKGGGLEKGIKLSLVYSKLLQ